MFYPARAAVLLVVALACGLNGCTNMGTAVADSRNKVVISVRDQRLTVVKADQTRETFAISTSKFGLGDRPKSYATPLGNLEIAGKIGAGAPAGTVFRGRVRTGEIVPENAPGRDPIVTRILRLRGLEMQNSQAASRGIYIHGTPEEMKIGEPVSYGCIRMRSADVIRLFDLVGVGSPVMILDSPMNQAVAMVAPPPPPAPKPVVPAVVPAVVPPALTPPTAQADEAPQVAVQAPPPSAAKPVHTKTAAAKPAVAKTETRVIPSVKRNSSGKWAGDPERLLGESATPKKVTIKTKTKTVQLAQQAKEPPTKSSRTDEGGSF